jgi:hypothetical protein
MPATPKEERSAPSRIFEDYTLTKVTAPGVGLVDIPTSIMTPLSGGTDLTYFGPYHIGEGYSDDASSALTPIGFDFELDGKTYQHFSANTNGFMILADPEFHVTGTIANLHQHVLVSGTNLTYRNDQVQDTIATDSVLLCPWFDDLKTLSDDITKVTQYSSQNERMVEEGLAPPPLAYDQANWGVRVYYDSKSNRGRRTIIRWLVQSNYSSSAAARLEFEVVLYENGTIEYRYIPKRQLRVRTTLVEDATIGIFMPGTYRFRDFSYGLGYRDDERINNVNGGATYQDNQSFEDNIDGINKKYVGNLSPDIHWPGLASAGSILAFQPPKNKRKVLPRLLQQKRNSRQNLPTILRTGSDRSGGSQVSFDDRRAVNYITGTIVNYPTTFQPIRGQGNTEPTLIERLDVFPGGLETTGSVDKAAIEQFLEPVDFGRPINPYNEANQFEQGPGTLDDEFYASGSLLELNQSLRSKTQVKFSLPISNTTTLFGQSSSLYYYNFRSKHFNVPRSSVVPTDETFDTIGSQSDISDPRDYVTNTKIPEDIRGFGPIGNVVGSGSNTPEVGTLTGTDSFINANYTTENATIAIQRPLEKSISKNPEYNAISDETFEIPINQPFILEKAVIEVPFDIGDSWFKDYTTSFLPHVAGEPRGASFDFAGPGITLSLMNQVKVGNSFRRDLILTGTITHTFDDKNEIVLRNAAPGSTELQLRPEGFRAFGTPSTVVTPNSSSTNGYTHSGPISVATEALVSNGVMLSYMKEMNDGGTPVTNREQITKLLSQDEIKLVSQPGAYADTFRIAYINPIGRGQTSFMPSGRSVFGKEYSTSQNIINDGKVSNPFFTETLSDELNESIITGSTFIANALINLEASERSPYLILPGDKLVLGLSKTRPYAYSTLGAAPSPPHPFFSGNLSHDVMILTGNVNITFYGTHLRAGEEVNMGLNQELASDAIHETIGSEPVLDQYDVFYADEYIGGFQDDFLTGSLIKLDGRGRVIKTPPSGSRRNGVLTGERGRVFSKFNARQQSSPDESEPEIEANPSLAYRLQPWFERVGTPRFNPVTNFEERYWDSMMPSINDVLKADNSALYIYNSGLQAAAPKLLRRDIGYLFFNDESHFGGGGGTSGQNSVIFNNAWTSAFPFESRYSRASRQLKIENSFIANYEWNFFDEPIAIEPKVVNGVVFNLSRPSPAADTGFETDEYWFQVSDVNLSTEITGSLSINDTLKVFYGYGDKNFMKPRGVNAIQGQYVGPTKFASFKQELENTTLPVPILVGPEIRGWKYGVHSGTPSYPKAYFRRTSFGQFRDMLEQMPFARYYVTPDRKNGRQRRRGTRRGIGPSAVEVKFVDTAGNLTAPENTNSQNLSQTCTSSLPYFDDGTIRNRPDLTQATQNSNIVSFGTDEFGNVSI